MDRAGLAVLCLASLASASGCSLLLDFSPGAIPPDGAPFTKSDCDYLEPNNTPAEAAAITTADVGPAAICSGDPEDHDFYRFTVPANTASVSVRISFSGAGATRDLDLRITDAAGATMYGQSRGFENEELIVCPGASPVCPALAAGDYLFEVFPATPGAVNRYDIALTITPM
jgi:hypothetical protein